MKITNQYTKQEVTAAWGSDGSLPASGQSVDRLSLGRSVGPLQAGVELVSRGSWLGSPETSPRETVHKIQGWPGSEGRLMTKHQMEWLPAEPVMTK